MHVHVKARTPESGSGRRNQGGGATEDTGSPGEGEGAAGSCLLSPRGAISLPP